MTFIGRTFVLTYDNGLQVVGRYAADSMTWEARTEPDKGTTGTEQIHTREVAPGVFFISWLERSGTTVSQILNLNTDRVSAFVTWTDGAQRQAALMHGSLAEAPDA
jgi:phenolic acid decarboxylase